MLLASQTATGQRSCPVGHAAGPSRRDDSSPVDDWRSLPLRAFCLLHANYPEG
jgi:hypothetical protein